MSNYRPSTVELVRVVAEFLEKTAPGLDSGARYEALVCGHILRLVERELEHGAPVDLDEAPLASAIRAGVHDRSWDQTLQQVLGQTVARVRLVKPDHLAPEHADRATDDDT